MQVLARSTPFRKKTKLNTLLFLRTRLSMLHGRIPVFRIIYEITYSFVGPPSQHKD
jgi:hypothetical protein